MQLNKQTLPAPSEILEKFRRKKETFEGIYRGVISVTLTVTQPHPVQVEVRQKKERKTLGCSNVFLKSDKRKRENILLLPPFMSGDVFLFPSVGLPPELGGAV